MHGLMIPKPTGEEGDYYLADGTPYFGPTHIGANMIRFTGGMPNPEAEPVLTREQLIMAKYRDLMISVGGGRFGTTSTSKAGFSAGGGPALGGGGGNPGVGSGGGGG